MLIYKDNKVLNYKEFFRNTSFPDTGPSDDFLLENNAYKVMTFKSYDVDTEKLVACDPYIENGLAYTVRVEIKSVDEIIADGLAKAEKIRAERNKRLSESDWTQLADSTADKTAWATYRQALRDIPNQSDFPESVVWPQKP